MKKVEIEKCVVDNFNGDLSDEQYQQLNLEFDKSPVLKQEADGLQQLWSKLEDIKPSHDTGGLDRNFYAMLENEKMHRRSLPRIRWFYQPVWQIAATILVVVMIYGAIEFSGKSTPKSSEQSAIVHTKNIGSDNITMRADKKSTAAVKNNYSERILRSRRGISVVKSTRKYDQLHSSFVSQRISAVSQFANQSVTDGRHLDRLTGLLETDESANVRIAVVDALRPVAGQTNVQTILIDAIGHQQDEIVKRYIIEVLFSSKAKKALPAITALLNDESSDPLTQLQIRNGITSLN